MIPIDTKYDIIYADPPWMYRDSKNPRGGTAKHYKVMSNLEILNLNVDWVSNENSALFLWATSPLLPLAMKTIESWGFTFKNVAFTWIKTTKDGSKLIHGGGSYTRANPEFCLLATKGNVAPWRQSASVSSVIQSPRREHSRKPEEARERIIELFGDRPRIELFARTSVPGWDCWGNETEKF